jgi:AcrR family transcriptional regulator
MSDEPPIPAPLLAVARGLIAKHGPEGLTLDAVAAALRVSRATVVRRCGSRQALLDALAEGGVDVGDRAEARTRILQAARVVFGRSGFEAASIDKIAEEARVAPATVYRHFGDKDGLVAAFLEITSPRSQVRAVLAQKTGDLRRDLERVATAMLTHVRKDEASVRLVFIEALRGTPLLPRVRAMSPSRTIDALRALLAEHLPPERAAEAQDLAQSFAGLLLSFGFIGPLFGAPPPIAPEERARFITNLFLRGARLPRRRRHEST